MHSSGPRSNVVFDIAIVSSLAWSVVSLTVLREATMANGRQKHGLALRWRKALAVAIAVIGTAAIGSFIPPQVEAQQRENLGLPLPGAPGDEKSVLPLPNELSIAVLPFDNMSNDPNQRYFSDGISEDLITDLSKSPGYL